MIGLLLSIVIDIADQGSHVIFVNGSNYIMEANKQCDDCSIYQGVSNSENVLSRFFQIKNKIYKCFTYRYYTGTKFVEPYFTNLYAFFFDVTWSPVSLLHSNKEVF